MRNLSGGLSLTSIYQEHSVGQQKKSSIAKLGILVGLVGVALAVIGSAKLISGNAVGPGLYICMIVCISIGCLMLMQGRATPKSGE